MGLCLPWWSWLPPQRPCQRAPCHLLGPQRPSLPRRSRLGSPPRPPLPPREKGPRVSAFARRDTQLRGRGPAGTSRDQPGEEPEARDFPSRPAVLRSFPGTRGRPAQPGPPGSAPCAPLPPAAAVRGKPEHPGGVGCDFAPRAQGNTTGLGGGRHRAQQQQSRGPWAVPRLASNGGRRGCVPRSACFPLSTPGGQQRGRLPCNPCCPGSWAGR